jgi:hypothetical protein
MLSFQFHFHKVGQEAECNARHGGNSTMGVIPTFRRLRQEDYKFRASLGYCREMLSQVKIKKKKEAAKYVTLVLLSSSFTEFNSSFVFLK